PRARQAGSGGGSRVGRAARVSARGGLRCGAGIPARPATGGGGARPPARSVTRSPKPPHQHGGPEKRQRRHRERYAEGAIVRALRPGMRGVPSHEAMTVRGAVYLTRKVTPRTFKKAASDRALTGTGRVLLTDTRRGQ